MQGRAGFNTTRRGGASNGGGVDRRKRSALERLARFPPFREDTRKFFRRIVNLSRAFVRARPRAASVLFVALGLLCFYASALCLGVGISRICHCHRKTGLCAIQRLWRKRCGNAMPDVDSEADIANDNGEGMLRFAGKGSSMQYGGVAWQMEQESPPPADRKEVRIAYFIQIGQDSIVLLSRLFQRVHHPDNVYVLHVDLKVKAEDRDYVRELVHGNPAYTRNMHIMQSEMLTYKGISMVLNTIGAMTLAYRVDQKWEYFINLSGADYPLLSPTAQRQLLARPAVPSGRLNFVSFFPTKEWHSYLFRVKYQFWDPAIVGHQDPKARVRRMKSMRVYPLESYRRYTFTKAEAWMILSRQFCQFVIRSAYAKKMLLNHVHTLSAPEHYFSDVLYNHPIWRKTVVPDAFRKVVWYHHRRRSGQHPYAMDDPKREPFEFWLYLKDTRSLFARKFSQPDAPLMERIDTELSGVRPLEKSSGDVWDSVQNPRQFFRRIASHFDHLTKSALEDQDVSLPAHAYPEIS